MKLLARYLADYWPLVALALVLAAVNQVFSLLDPLIFRYVIDQYATRFSEYTTGEFFRGVSLLLAALGRIYPERLAQLRGDARDRRVLRAVGNRLRQRRSSQRQPEASGHSSAKRRVMPDGHHQLLTGACLQRRGKVEREERQLDEHEHELDRLLGDHLGIDPDVYSRISTVARSRRRGNDVEDHLMAHVLRLAGFRWPRDLSPTRPVGRARVVDVVAQLRDVLADEEAPDLEVNLENWIIRRLPRYQESRFRQRAVVVVANGVIALTGAERAG